MQDSTRITQSLVPRNWTHWHVAGEARTEWQQMPDFCPWGRCDAKDFTHAPLWCAVDTRYAEQHKYYRSSISNGQPQIHTLDFISFCVTSPLLDYRCPVENGCRVDIEQATSLRLLRAHFRKCFFVSRWYCLLVASLEVRTRTPGK